MRRNPLQPWYTVYQAPEDDNAPGSSGTDGGHHDDNDLNNKDDEDKGDEPDPRLDALETAVRTLAQGQASVNQVLTELNTRLEKIGQPPVKENKEDKGGMDLEGVDLETMDRKQYAAYLLTQMKSIVEGSIKPLGERFGQLDSKIDAQALGGMIKEFQKDHPDFFEWKGEMRELLKDNPTLTPARAYALVRAESPEKAKQLDKKYGLFKEERKPNGGDTLLSLFPTSSSSATKGRGKMTASDAAEAAWDEVMSNLRQG